MEDPTIQKINDYIDEFFFMEKGDLISYPDDNIALDKKSTLSKIGLKHIVESRKDDHYSAKEIKERRIPKREGLFLLSINSIGE